jgi:hypothetical protein
MNIGCEAAAPATDVARKLTFTVSYDSTLCMTQRRLSCQGATGDIFALKKL